MNKHQAAFWEKDGRWHITKRHEPTADERRQFPVSYPPNDPGPFFIWDEVAFDTREEAIAALADRVE